jgi:diguanylate cyclase (GGDEF)-like protein/PAS domain S-box-containing protein
MRPRAGLDEFLVSGQAPPQPLGAQRPGRHNALMELLLRRRFLGATWTRYAVGLGLFSLALAVRLAFFPVEARLTYGTFVPAMVLAMYVCGLGPGALVAALSAIAGLYFFSPPHFSFRADAASQLGAQAFLFGSAITGWVVHRLQTKSRDLDLALQRLRVSERMLQTVVTEQTDMVFRFGRDGRFLFANPAGRRTFGLTDESMPTQTWHVLVLAEERAAVTDRLREFAPGRPVVKTETRFIGSDGETRWGEFVHQASFDTDGRLKEVQTVGRDITERHALQNQLADMSATLQDLYDQAPCGYYSIDTQGRFVQVNATGLAWLGCSAEDVIGKLGPIDFFTPEGVAEFQRNFPKYLAQGHIGPLEFDLIGRDGKARRISVSATAVRDAGGAVVRSRSVMYDITELARVRHELSVLNRQQVAMLDNELIGITRLKDRRSIWQNRALEQMFGYEPGELMGLPSQVIYPDAATFNAVGEAAYPILASGGTYRTQLQLVRKDGGTIWVDMSGAMVSPETGVSMWMMLDITAMKNDQEKVERIAFHDALTGLPNRLLLGDRLQQAIPLGVRLQRLVAVCFIDLDGFKAVNDKFGHAAGDRLLQVIAERLQGCVRSNDTVSRFGGDEFVLLLQHLHSREECDQVLGRVETAVGEPVHLGHGAIGRVSASIGVAFSPDDGTDANQLLMRADEAMYAAKKSRREQGGAVRMD